MFGTQEVVTAGSYCTFQSSGSESPVEGCLNTVAGVISARGEGSWLNGSPSVVLPELLGDFRHRLELHAGLGLHVLEERL